MGAGVLSFVAALGLAPLVGSEFVPEADEGFTQLALRMPVGSGWIAAPTAALLVGSVLDGLALMLLMFGNLAEPVRLAVWAVLAAGLWVLRLLHYLRYRRRPDADGATLKQWRRSWRAPTA